MAITASSLFGRFVFAQSVDQLAISIGGTKWPKKPHLDKFFGDVGGNTISGDVHSNFIKGNEGDDTLSGGGGNDKIFGNAGSDVLRVGLEKASTISISCEASGEHADVGDGYPRFC